jgi:hypothetical protein
MPYPPKDAKVMLMFQWAKKNADIIHSKRK